MKKKVALLVASVMTLSLMIPSMSVFAASSTTLSSNPSTVPTDTVLYETQLFLNAGTGTGTIPMAPTASNNVSVLAGTFQGSTANDPAYQVDGTDLVITLNDTVSANDQFRVQLTNAEWFFRSLAAPVSTTSMSALAVTPTGTLTATDNYATTDGTMAGAIAAAQTYDTARGVYYSDSTTATSGNYYRYYQPSRQQNNANGTVMEVPYKLTVSSLNESNATVTILGLNGGPSSYTPTANAPLEIRIPLVSMTTGGPNVSAAISGNLTAVTPGTFIFSQTASSATNTYVNTPPTSRDNFSLDDVIIQEQRIGSIPSGPNQVFLTCPSGFTWDDPTNSSIAVGLEPGLTWQSNNASGFGARGTDWTLGYNTNWNSQQDLTTLLFTFNTNTSTTLAGYIYIQNLSLTASTSAPWGDFNIAISNASSNNPVTAQTNILAGHRVDWGVSVSTTGTIPTLITGRYYSPDTTNQNVDNATHQTAHIVFSENTVNSWWAQREADFTVPASAQGTPGVKFRKIQFTSTSNLSTSLENAQYNFPTIGAYNTQASGVFLNDGVLHGNVMVDGNKIALTNLSVTATDTGAVEFDAWVSVEAGYGPQDITLSVSGSGIPTDASGSVPSCVIAHTQNPISVASQVTDLKIGYQYQKTADITITELGAGYLQTNNQVRVSVTDMISNDMWLTPDTTVTVTNGDMQINNVSVGGGDYASGVLLTSPASLGVMSATDALTFNVQQASSVASTITISNVAVKLDRTVPYTNNEPYQAVVWGSAVAANFGTNRDMFSTPGYSVPYINVVSAADGSAILTQEVRVTIGQSYVTVNGQQMDMDAAAFIDPTSNSTMVPVRFLAVAFGLNEDGQIIWDGTNKTASIIAPTKVVQFQAGSSTMVVGGANITMHSPDGLAVKAQIKGDAGHERMYIPFRALGDAFGIPVTWDADTQTAIYNQGANTGATAAAATATPAPTATPAA